MSHNLCIHRLLTLWMSQKMVTSFINTCLTYWAYFVLHCIIKTYMRLMTCLRWIIILQIFYKDIRSADCIQSRVDVSCLNIIANSIREIEAHGEPVHLCKFSILKKVGALLLVQMQDVWVELFSLSSGWPHLAHLVEGCQLWSHLAHVDKRCLLEAKKSHKHRNESNSSIQLGGQYSNHCIIKTLPQHCLNGSSDVWKTWCWYSTHLFVIPKQHSMGT